jgi:hypothetical protein
MEKRYHYTVCWDCEDGKNSIHMICTPEELTAATDRIRKQHESLWFLSTGRNDNPGVPGAAEYQIAYRDSSLLFDSYYFTGSQTDLEREVAWLRSNGYKDVQYELAEPAKPINKTRVNMVRAMETIARAVNDEYVFDLWLSIGVADGDIDEDTTDEELEDYCDDETFAGLMDAFLKLMARAKKSGGLYCDDIASEEAE